MPMRPRSLLRGIPLAVAVAVALLLVSAGGEETSLRQRTGSAAASWRGLVGGPRQVALGRRVLVVLKAPSLADRVARAGGGRATPTSAGGAQPPRSPSSRFSPPSSAAACG